MTLPAGTLTWIFANCQEVASAMNECQEVPTQQQDEAIHSQTGALVTTLGHTERGCGVNKQAHRSIQQFSVRPWRQSGKFASYEVNYN